MNSIILCTATRLLMPLLLLLSMFLLLRGHNQPGGGFIGGLVAASAFALYAIAFGEAAARKALHIHPRTFIGVGLVMAVISGLISLLKGYSFMTGLWGHIHVPFFGDFYLGTPLLFDMGVFTVVIGVTLMIIFSLGEE